ncbi:putative hydrolase YxeP [Azoarcus sp. Aa7]|nr:putative hydrolase YxeP [Azoarcus sp. Aa7]
MTAIAPALRALEDEMIAIRRRIHAHPELAYEEHATSELVAAELERAGYTVHRGIARTGVVATLTCGGGTRRIGLRADMDALPIHEQTGLPWASTLPGKMHACGHDGHTAMLLAAARHLAHTRTFDGTLTLIFQPAEEGESGARRMLAEGVLERFPCDAVFAMHNMPGYPVGKLGFRSGPFMASVDDVGVTIRGYGGHGAMPHEAVDPVVVAAHVVVGLQSIVARNVPPLETAIVTVGSIQAGEANNVIPDTAELRMSVRALSPAVRTLLHKRITALVESTAIAYGASAEVRFDNPFPVLVNDGPMTEFARKVAIELVGEDGLIPDLPRLTGSEDFSYFLERSPGCYLIIGNGDGKGKGKGSCMVHNPGYDFNDDALITGAAYWVKLVESFLRPVRQD